MKQAKIYKITNHINSKVYVGQTYQSIEDRFKRHCAEARWKNKKKMPIVLAISKYGQEHFKISLLEILPPDTPQELVDERELFWGNFLNCFSPSGYNLRLGNGKGCLSPEIVQKISQSNTGKVRSLETKKRLSESHIRIRHKQSTKDKLSSHFKGKSPHPNTTAGSIKHNTKSYVLLSPDGVVTPIYGMKSFAEKTGLKRGGLSQLATGKIKQYKGWTLP